MSRKLLSRLIIDLSMTIFMLVAMAYPITGNTVHEVVGTILFVLFIVHNFLNRRWYKAIFKGTYSIQRALSIAVNLIFLGSMAAVLLSSIPISRDIFDLDPIQNQMIMSQTHVLTAYWGFIFMTVHIGISWGRMIHTVRKITGITGTNYIRTIVIRVVAVLIVVYGVQASFEQNMGTKLIIYNPFGWGHNDSTLRFIIDYLSIMGIYIAGTHYSLKFIHNKGGFIKDERTKGNLH